MQLKSKDLQTRYNTLSILLVAVWGTDKQMQLRLVGGGLLVLISSLLSMVMPWLLKFVVDSFYNPSMAKLLFWVFISYGMLWATSQVIINLRQILVYRSFERGIHKFSLKIFQKLLDLPISYHIHNATGSIMNYIERAQAAIPDVLFGLLFVILPVVIEIIVVGGILWYHYGFVFGFSLLLIFILYLLFTWLIMDWVLIAKRDANYQHTQVSSYITDVLMNIEGVHYQFGQNLALEQCKSKVVDRENAVVRQLVRMDVVGIGQNLIAGGGLIFMTTLIGFKVIKHKLIVGDFILFNGYLLQFLAPLNMIGYIIRNLRDDFTKMEDVINLLKQDTELISKSIIKITEISKEIKFESVSFTYPNKTEFILQDINFSLPVGKTTAIIGANGSGKSTITKLMYHFYEVSSGKILIQGKDIKDINLASLRKIIGIVPQEVFMFNASIYTNLVFGDLDISSDFFNEVMDIVGINELVKNLPKGYNTEVGERGLKISGGERQKIGIARTLLRQPKLLILDEATSALDVATEQRIFDYLNKNHRAITQLIITHNLRRINHVNQIIFMQDGKIIDCGTHQELLINKQYNKLWQ
jgi:ATP-binding cassette subfamily B protein